MKKTKLVFGWKCVFFALVILPGIGNLLAKDIIKEATDEYRILAEKPKLSVENFEEFPTRYTDYYNDHLIFRQELVRLNSLMLYEIFNTSTSDNVIVGDENWLYYTDETSGNPLMDYKGLLQYTTESMQEIVENLEEFQSKLQEQGAELIILIPPNKENVYEEYMPDNIKTNSDLTRTDSLVEFIKTNSSLEVIYPKEELQQYKDQFQLYFKQDTHWNQLGAFIAVQQITDVLYGEREYLEQQEIMRETMSLRSTANRDLARMLNLQNWFQDDYEYIIDGYQTFEQWDVVDFYNDSAQYDQNIMVIGDSYRVSMKPYLSCLYRESHIISRDDFSFDMIEEEKPDIVILERLERYSDELCVDE